MSGGSGSVNLDQIKEVIQFPRLKIIGETDDSYLVEYGGQKISFAKGDESYFVKDPKSENSCENVPNEFTEVMVFHEMREIEYENSEISAHQKAVHDEVLSVLKYLPELQGEYFVFAKKYRAAATANANAKNEELQEDGLSRKKEVIEAISYNGMKLGNVPKILQNDKEVVMAAVSSAGEGILKGGTVSEAMVNIIKVELAQNKDKV